jgi:hypothetical protein
MKSGIKMVLIISSIIGAYWLGNEVGKETEKKNEAKANEILATYKTNNEILISECTRLHEQNKSIKKFYNVVEGIKMEEA